MGYVRSPLPRRESVATVSQAAPAAMAVKTAAATAASSAVVIDSASVEPRTREGGGSERSNVTIVDDLQRGRSV